MIFSGDEEFDDDVTSGIGNQPEPYLDMDDEYEEDSWPDDADVGEVR